MNCRTRETSNACKWEVIQSIAYGGLDSLWHVAMPGSQVAWTTVQENVFTTLPTTDQGVADLVTSVRDRIGSMPARSSTRGAGDTWWETRWTDSATSMFSERLQLLSMLTEHLRVHRADAGVRAAFGVEEPIEVRDHQEDTPGGSWTLRRYQPQDGVAIAVAAAPSSEPLGIPFGVDVDTVGRSTDDMPAMWQQDFSPTRYLMEFRSAIRAMRRLLAATG
jgi:hypothetical protein